MHAFYAFCSIFQEQKDLKSAGRLHRFQRQLNNIKWQKMKMKLRNNMAGVIGQRRRQYGNVRNQFNECIQNYKHIRQRCARRRHNSEPIGLFVFPVEFASNTLPVTSELVLSTITFHLIRFCGWMCDHVIHCHRLRLEFSITTAH